MNNWEKIWNGLQIAIGCQAPQLGWLKQVGLCLSYLFNILRWNHIPKWWVFEEVLLKPMGLTSLQWPTKCRIPDVLLLCSVLGASSSRTLSAISAGRQMCWAPEEVTHFHTDCGVPQGRGRVAGIVLKEKASINPWRKQQTSISLSH